MIRRLGVPGYGDDELEFVDSTLTRLRPEVVFEWGTNVGASARIFREFGCCEVHTWEHPDPATHDHPGHRYGEWCYGRPGITMHLGDGALGAVSLHEELGPERALFFLDGDHSYAAVLGEISIVFRYAPAAIVLVHDTHHPLERTGLAVRDFVLAHPEAYVHTEISSQAGMARLWPRSL